MTTSGYHDVHLPPDPARDVVWPVIADYVARWVPAKWLVRAYLRSPIRPLAGQMLRVAEKA